MKVCGSLMDLTRAEFYFKCAPVTIIFLCDAVDFQSTRISEMVYFRIIGLGIDT